MSLMVRQIFRHTVEEARKERCVGYPFLEDGVIDVAKVAEMEEVPEVVGDDRPRNPQRRKAIAIS